MTFDPWAKKKSLYNPYISKNIRSRKIKWKPLLILWGAIKKMCTVIGAIVVIASFAWGFIFASLFSDLEPKQISLPEKIVLYVELDGALSDISQNVDFLDPFAKKSLTLLKFVDALDRAKNDSRVKGLYARFENGGYSVAQIQEIRNAIKRFSSAGKFTYIYSSSLAETGGLGSYYLASSFDQIWMQPMGNISIAGMNAETPFLRSLLDEIGIRPQFFQRKEYKSAYENLTHSGMTSANKEMLNAIISDIADSIIQDISKDRKLSADKLKTMVNQALFTSPEAQLAGLIDFSGYADTLVENINEKVLGNKNATDLLYITLADYLEGSEWPLNNIMGQVEDIIGPKQVIKEKALEKSDIKVIKPVFKKPKIALIYALGAITNSKQVNTRTPSLIVDDHIAPADEISAALYDAADDPSINAVVLRVDSPGGSPVASETILRAVQMVQLKGKHVTVSMGSMAASGGYWISSSADRIFANSTTLTGSIGVLGGKFSTKELWSKLKVNWDGVKWGENAGMWSMNTPFSDKEADRVNAMLDNVYTSFIDRVAKGRKLSEKEVELIARGRVWTGSQAIENKLVDQIGGLDSALDYTAMKYGAEGRFSADIVILPKPLTPLEEIIQIIEDQVVAGKVYSAMGKIITEISPAFDQISVYQRANGINVYEPVNIN